MLGVVANVALEPGGILGWILIGLIAGGIAGRVVEGRGMGCIGDVIVGIAGAFIGAFVVGFVIGGTRYEFWGTLIVAFIGSVLLLLVVRLIVGRRPRG